jgi:methionyl-tRNA synthetase
MNVARLGNKYLADENDKTDAGRVQTQMYVALQIAAALSSLCEPFLPLQPLNYLNIKNRKSVELNFRYFRLLPAGHQIGEAELLFKN